MSDLSEINNTMSTEGTEMLGDAASQGLAGGLLSLKILEKVMKDGPKMGENLGKAIDDNMSEVL